MIEKFKWSDLELLFLFSIKSEFKMSLRARLESMTKLEGSLSCDSTIMELKFCSPEASNISDMFLSLAATGSLLV